MEEAPKKEGCRRDIFFNPAGDSKFRNFPVGSERRKFPRVRSQVPIQYKQMDRLSEPFAACLSRDIGEGGVGFTSDKFIPVDSKLVMEFSLYNTAEPMKALVRVVWVARLPRADRYTVGLEFIDIPQDHRKLVREFAKKNIERL